RPEKLLKTVPLHRSSFLRRRSRRSSSPEESKPVDDGGGGIGIGIGVSLSRRRSTHTEGSFPATEVDDRRSSRATCGALCDAALSCEELESLKSSHGFELQSLHLQVLFQHQSY
ncbi:hypothetical protein F8388_015099, partial [Cannabis sativa]